MRHVLRLRKYVRELCDGCAHLKRKVFQYVSQRSMQARLHSSSMYNRLVYGGISQKDFRWRFSSLPSLLSSSRKWKSAWWVIDSPRALQGRKDLGWVGRTVVEVVGGWVGLRIDLFFFQSGVHLWEEETNQTATSVRSRLLGDEVCHRILWVLWDEALSCGEKPSSSVPSGELQKAVLRGGKPGLPVRKPTHYFSPWGS